MGGEGGGGEGEFAKTCKTCRINTDEKYINKNRPTNPDEKYICTPRKEDIVSLPVTSVRIYSCSDQFHAILIQLLFKGVIYKPMFYKSLV